MQRRRRRARLRAWLALLATAALPLGCGGGGKIIWIELAAFGAGAVDGVWLWRWSEADGAYERSCRIELGNAEVDADGEFLLYVQTCPGEQPFAPARGRVERYVSDPDAVRLRIRYGGGGRSGVYRVSSYGARGETGLSATTLQL